MAGEADTGSGGGMTGGDHKTEINMQPSGGMNDRGHSAGMGIVSGLLLGGVGLGLVGGGIYAAVASGKTTMLLVNQAKQGAQMDYIQAQTNQNALGLVRVPELISLAAMGTQQFVQNQGVRDFEKRWHHHEGHHEGVRIASPNQFDNAGGYNAVRR